jgi:hypothetical protein
MYVMTDEHRKRLPEYRDMAIANAFSVEPMTALDREICTAAAKASYALAKLEEPRVVFASSPIAGQGAAGIGVALEEAPPERLDELLAAVDKLSPHLRQVAMVALAAAGHIEQSPGDTELREEGQTQDRWVSFASPDPLFAVLGRNAARRHARAAADACQGGNQWSGPLGMYEFFREVAQLDMDWAPWLPWRDLCKHSGPRFETEHFVVVCDRPELLCLDEDNRPHSLEGPACRWRDGAAYYAVHGVYVPGWVVELPEAITLAHIDDEENAEVRRVMIDQFGVGKYADAGETVDKWHDEKGGPMRLLRRIVPGQEEPVQFLQMTNSTPNPDGTVKQYWVRVDPEIVSCMDARNSICQLWDGATIDTQT